MLVMAKEFVDRSPFPIAIIRHRVIPVLIVVLVCLCRLLFFLRLDVFVRCLVDVFGLRCLEELGTKPDLFLRFGIHNRRMLGLPSKINAGLASA